MIVNNTFSGFSWKADTSKLFKQREKTVNQALILIICMMAVWIIVDGFILKYRIAPEMAKNIVFWTVLSAGGIAVLAGAARLRWLYRELEARRSWVFSGKNEEGQTRDEALTKHWDDLGFTMYNHSYVPQPYKRSWSNAEGGSDMICTYGIWTQPNGLRVTRLSFVGPVIAKRHLRQIPVQRFTVSLDGPGGLDTTILHIWRHNGEEPVCEVVDDFDRYSIRTILEAFADELRPFGEVNEGAMSTWLYIAELIKSRDLERNFQTS